MLGYAALAWLDVVEALLALRQTNEIISIASRLFDTFKNAGMITSALTAIAYLKEAAATGRLSATGVSNVRKYFRRAERQPEVLFEPPADFSR